MTKDVQTTTETPSPEGSQQRTLENTDSKQELGVETVPRTDLDNLRSIKDKEIAAERKARSELERRLAELEQRIETEIDRRQYAENKASDAQTQVNLRNFARQLAKNKYGVWGSDVEKKAEEKFLQAESRDHLISLEHEFATADLPSLVRSEDKEAERQQRRQQTLETTVGVTSSRLPAPAEKDTKGLNAIDDYLQDARSSRNWKDSSEGRAALRKAKSILGNLGYPSRQIRDWAQVANAASTLRRLGVGLEQSRMTKV